MSGEELPSKTWNLTAKLNKLRILNHMRLMGDNQKTLEASNKSAQQHKDLQARVSSALADHQLSEITGKSVGEDSVEDSSGEDGDQYRIDSPDIHVHETVEAPVEKLKEEAGGKGIFKSLLGISALTAAIGTPIGMGVGGYQIARAILDRPADTDTDTVEKVLLGKEIREDKK